MKNKFIKIFLVFGVILLSLFSSSCDSTNLEYLEKVELKTKLSLEGQKYFYNCIYGYKFPEHIDFNLFKSSNEIKEYFSNNDKYIVDDNFIKQVDLLEETGFFEINNIIYFGACIFRSSTEIEITKQYYNKNLFINFAIYHNTNPNIIVSGGEFMCYFNSIKKEEIIKYPSFGYQMTYLEVLKEIKTL